MARSVWQANLMLIYRLVEVKRHLVGGVGESGWYSVESSDEASGEAQLADRGTLGTGPGFTASLVSFTPFRRPQLSERRYARK